MMFKSLEDVAKARGGDVQLARLRHLDDRFLWFGYAVLPQHARTFGISEAQARIDLRTYRELTGGEDQDVRKDRLGPSARVAGTIKRPEPFRPLFGKDRELDDLITTTLASARPVIGVELYQAPTLKRRVDPAAVMAILAACEQKSCCRMTYQSMTSEGRERLISPHVICKASGRWHVRAYDFDKKRFADFALSRVKRSKPDESERAAPQSLDRDWARMIEVELIPHPDLGADKAKAVAVEYGMRDERISITVRKAMLIYLLDELRLLGGVKENDPEIAYASGLWVSDVDYLRKCLGEFVSMRGDEAVLDQLSA